MSQLDNILEKLRRVAQDKDVDDKKGTQPKKYYSGVDKDQKSARDAHFKKGAKMDDDNPDAYKPAPGDKGAKTKPSKHTKKFKQMYGEAESAAQQAAIAIAKKKSGKYDKDGKRLEKEACWDGYKQVGMKKKGKKMVPDCVPEEIEEGKLVAPIENILDSIVKKLKSEMGRQYRKRPTDGLAFINRVAQMVNGKVTDKKQQKGHLFLKMDYDLSEKDVTAISTWKKKLRKVKGLTKDQLQAISQIPTPVLTTMLNQLSMIVAQKEELDKNSDAGDYIDDFRKSDAPQFKGKSDKKIRQMAIAAYLDAKEKK